MDRLIEWDVYIVRYDSSYVGPSFLCQLIPGKDPIGVIGHRLLHTTLDGFLLGIWSNVLWQVGHGPATQRTGCAS